MVHLTRKKRNGIIYLYLEERARINGKSTRLWQKYLGREDKIKELSLGLASPKVEYKTYDFGRSMALWHVAKKIGFVEIINKYTNKKRDQGLSIGEYLLILTINRCIAPVSKSKLGKWFQQDFLSHLLPISPSVLNSQTYWNHFQYFDEEIIAKIETELLRRTLDVYNIEFRCLLFDPTNFFTFFEEHSTEQLAQFGHSKEHRNNLRIINLSLLCSMEFGIPLFHKTYKGNIQDAKHFKTVLSEIADRMSHLKKDLIELVLIFDKGNHSSEAFEYIDSIQLRFIASLRNSTQKDLLQISLSQFKEITLPNTQKVFYYYTQRQIYANKRSVYVVHDPKKYKKEVFILEETIQKKLTQIKTFLEKLNQKKWRSKEAVIKKLKGFIGKKPFSELLLFTVKGTYAKLKVSLRIQEHLKEPYLNTRSRFIIFTNLHTWTPTQIVHAFREKYLVENSFKALKDTKILSIRPIFHWSDTCIRTHVFSNILGLLLVTLLRLELSDPVQMESFESLLLTLSELKLTQISVSQKGKPYVKLNRASQEANSYLKKLQLHRFFPKK